MTDGPEQRGPVERIVTRGLEKETGKPISERARMTQRSVDAYLRAGVRPRWMERLMEIEQLTSRARRELSRAYRDLRRTHGHDPETFEKHWRSIAGHWDFRDLNELVRAHNQWYPMERDLPMDPRTGDYVRVLGRSYRRRELDLDWVFEQFPPRPS